MNCDVCDSKDQIEIAGKTFCASCGSVDSFVDKSSIGSGMVNPSTDQANNQINTSYQMRPTQIPAQQNPIQTNTATSPAISDNNQINPVVNNVQPQQGNLQSNVSNVPTQNTVSNINQPVPVPPSTPVIANQTPANTPQMPINPTIPPVVNQNIANNQSLPQAQNQAIQDITSVNKADGVQAENIGNEIGQLSKKDNLVFSDDELDQLANEKPATTNVVNPFADISNNLDKPNPQTKPIEDIRPNNNQMFPPPINSNTTAEVKPNNNDVVPVNNMAASPAPIQSVPNTPIQASPLQVIQTDVAKNNLQANVLTNQVQQSKNPSKLKKHSGKVASVGLSLAGVILLGIYVWQINYPNLALKVAGSKAGISASMPSYLPNGWRISGDIQSNPGSISYKLASADGDKSVSVNEVRSDWDSQALAENYLSPNADKYTALQSEGLTIYIYNNNQASWVNHGTWYRIEGQDHGLSRDQIIKMATSL